MSTYPLNSGDASSSTHYEPGLHPVPMVEDKHVISGPVHPYPGGQFGPSGPEAQILAEKRWFGLRRSTVILSALIFVLVAGIAAIGGVFGSKIGKLEAQLPPTATTPDPVTPTQVLPGESTTDIQIGGYSYVGCFTDGVDRALPEAETTTDALTNRQCASFCSDYRYFGSEYGTQCYCGDEMAYESPAAPWHCATHCKGAKEGAENCGGFFYLSVWKKDD